ncbi:MAG: FAD-dependent oxidoreductase [Oscillospiraceae bacterium]|jgi:2,4-dienoyl-CoA reductase-like NADH-dependent reductase (Old Yellow Enzyme family)/thioredoxin reductase
MNTIEQKYPNLMAPFDVKGVHFKNHIFVPPCALSHVTYGAPNDLGIAYIEELARGGAAQVTQGNVNGPGGYGDNSGHYNRYFTNCFTEMAFTELSTAIKQHGAVASAEINHAGFMAGLAENNNTPPMSSMGFVRADGVEVVEMTEKMIDDCATMYAKTAKFLKDCGFQMCMVHGGHEMLINQFMSPRYNKRKDRFGGSPENRIRFPKMILERIRDLCGDDFPIEMRISAVDHWHEGKHIEESIFFVKECEHLIDFIHISSGSGPDAAYLTQEVCFQPEGLNIQYAEAMKKAGVKPLVVVMGGIVSPEVAESFLAEGKADVVAMARAIMADPQLPNKIRRNQLDEIRPCLRCNHCLGSNKKVFFEAKCMVNPFMAHEHRNKLQLPALESRKVLIIGGGVAGMQAAITAADRGHQVTIAEKEDALGGTIRFSDHDSIKVQLRKYKNYLIRQVSKRNIRVLLNTSASVELLEAEQPDAILVATGSKPIVPRIPGIERENVYYAVECYESPEKIGKKVVIIGGGLVGCEVGSHLANTGHEVEVLEMGPELAPEDNPFHHAGMMAFWKDKPIHGSVNSKVIEITDEGVVAENESGCRVTFKADTVLYCVGLKPDTSVYEEMKKYCYDVVAIGDCAGGGRIVDAVEAGFNMAIDLA